MRVVKIYIQLKSNIMKKANVFILAIAFITLIACGKKTSTSPDIEANKKLVEQWDEAFNKSDLDALSSLYTIDAIRMQPNEPVLNGREAIRASFKSYFDQNETILDDNKAVEVTIAGDYAIAHGNYTSDYKPKSGGTPVHDEGKWVSIRKRQADGSWKAVMDIWNSDLPAVAVNQ
jgi:uncharacterized protein (TIGR02246 family)